MENSITVFDIISAIRKRWKLIVLTSVMAAIISGTITYFFLTPVYQASTQILVNQKNTEKQFDYSLLQSNVELINTYSVILKSPVILEKVIDQLNLTLNWEDLNKNITVTSQENSQVFTLNVENQSAAKAVEIANAISEIFQEEIKSIMNVDNVSILAKAELKQNPIPVKPTPILNIIIAVVVGLLVGMGIALILEFMDNTLKNEQDVAAYLGLPVLGSIDKMSKGDKKGNNCSVSHRMGSETSVS